MDPDEEVKKILKDRNKRGIPFDTEADENLKCSSSKKMKISTEYRENNDVDIENILSSSNNEDTSSTDTDFFFDYKEQKEFRKAQNICRKKMFQSKFARHSGSDADSESSSQGEEHIESKIKKIDLKPKEELEFIAKSHRQTEGVTLKSSESCAVLKLKTHCFEEISQLLKKEENDFSVRRALFESSPLLDPQGRSLLIEWIMDLCNTYTIKRETCYLAVDYYDRYMASIQHEPRSNLLLIGFASFLIAAKLKENIVPRVKEFDYICTASDIKKQEILMLATLKFELKYNTATTWLYFYLKSVCISTSDCFKEISTFTECSVVTYKKASAILDLCTMDEKIWNFKPSCIAASIIYQLIDKKKALYISTYVWEELEPCVKWVYPFKVVIEKKYSSHPGFQDTQKHDIVTDESFLLQHKYVDYGLLSEVKKLQEELHDL